MSTDYSQQIKFIPFCKKNIKYLYKDMLISCIFILLSSTTPVLSLSNSAWFVLLWYVMSVGLLLILNWIETCCNVQNKIKRKLLKKYHYRKNLTSKEKKRIVNYKNTKVEFGGWTFFAVKFSVACIFVLIFLPISLGLQFFDFNNYVHEQKNFFVSFFMSTFVTTLFTAYYSIIVNEVKEKKGIKNRLKALFIYANKSLVKRIFGNLLLYLMLLYAFIYSLFSFTIFAPLFVGVVYVCTLLMPIKDEKS